MRFLNVARHITKTHCFVFVLYFRGFLNDKYIHENTRTKAYQCQSLDLPKRTVVIMHWHIVSSYNHMYGFNLAGREFPFIDPYLESFSTNSIKNHCFLSGTGEATAFAVHGSLLEAGLIQ